MRVLLVSNSGRPFLEHCRDTIAAFVGERRRIAFVTAATYGDEAEYCARARLALEPAGLEVVHFDIDRPGAELDGAEALFVGGGNTYHLLRRLHAAHLVETLRQRVAAGLPYIGSSAGSNIAGPNILTTNDWNADGTTRFDALGLVPFNVNPHYQEVDPAMAPTSETRAERIGEFHRVHAQPVVGIEESTCVRCEDGVYTVLGSGRVVCFRRDRPPRAFGAGQRLEF